MNQEPSNVKSGEATASSAWLDDDTLRKLLDAAEKVRPKPTPPNPKDVVMEMYEVIGTLWEKGMPRKQMLAWLKRRGYVFKEYHIGLALRHYHDAKSSNDKSSATAAGEDV